MKKKETQTEKTLFACISHEIRTPMNGIIGMTELALQEEMSPELREYLSIIRLSADSLLTVINDLLDYSKLESGKMSLETLDIETGRFMNELLALTQPLCMEKNIILTHKASKNVPERIKGDPVRIRQIFQNLINNAVKFTGKNGHIEIRTDYEKENGSGYLVASVCDSGIGISEEAREKLFSPFFQAERTTARKYGGTGLGLTVCRMLTELMGGEISVESTLGEGTCFQFRIKAEEGGASRTEENSLAIPDLSGKRILLAEDNDVNRLIAVKLLEKTRAAITCAENGKIAVDRFKETTPDLILMDLQMPEMSGFEASETIKNLPEGKKIPIIALSALSMNEDKETAKKTGINGFITKPFIPEDLFSLLSKHLL